MPSKKKKFIDKKHAVTFSVVHRSQKDPKIADDEAPQRVLLSSHHEEQLKYGIDFDDDYDYLQHLKDVNELCQVETDTYRIGIPSSEFILKSNADKPRLLLPSSVFASEIETSIGLLNKNIPLIGPQPNLDPDILAALDGEIYSDEDELDDNFVSFANAEFDARKIKANDECDNLNDGSLCHSDDTEDDDDADNDDDDDDDKSRFTGYSMTSSVIQRNVNLQLVDAKFDKFYKKFKNDDEVDCDVDDDNGNSANDEILHQLISQYRQKQNEKDLEMQKFVEIANNLNMGSDVLASSSENRNDVIIITDDNDDDDEMDDEDEEMEKIDVHVPDYSWDCESIISTYSTTKNQPHIVSLPSKKSIKPTSQHQLPADIILSQKSKILEEETTIPERTIPQIIRNRNETKEEKLARKRIIKDLRRERRLQKSENKEFFKDEHIRLKKQLIINKENCLSSVHLQ